MSENLCLQWNDFTENVNSAFARLRDDKEFTDVTLACEDGQQIEAHKAILAASSPFFGEILLRNKHPHPLIYLRGFKLQDLVAILDFLYCGKASVLQENLDSFLAIAEELKLKGLAIQSSSEFVKEEETHLNPTPSNNSFQKSTTYRARVCNYPVEDVNTVEKIPISPDIPNQYGSDLQVLDEKVKSMMGKIQNKIQSGRQAQSTCKVCGKEGGTTAIRNHIEANHLEGISIPCVHCDKAFGSRVALGMHIGRSHK